MDNLLSCPSGQGFEVVGFADDVVITVRGKDEAAVSSRMQIAFDLTERWSTLERLY